MESTMNAMEPTYFLYSGQLFHDVALPALLMQPKRGDDASETQPHRGEDPGPEGPEGEPVGDEDEPANEDGDDDEGGKESKPAPVPGPGLPIVPEHGSPDANPIDPRVF
jgi:hypothetical protein